MKKNYFKLRFNLWLKSFHFKRFQTIMIVVGIIVIFNCIQGNYISLLAIPCSALLFGGFTLFPKLFINDKLDNTLENLVEEQKEKDYNDYINSPEYIRQQRKKKLERLYNE